MPQGKGGDGKNTSDCYHLSPREQFPEVPGVLLGGQGGKALIMRLRVSFEQEQMRK